MKQQTLPAPAAPPRHERGLGYALLGGLGVTAVTFLIGGALIAWFFVAQQRNTPPELLPADTQLYAALAPTIEDLPEPERVADALRDTLGITDAPALADAVEGLLGVPISGNITNWIGSGMAVAVAGLDSQAIDGADPAASLLQNGELLFILTSRNDPQAEAFLARHLEVRANRGEQMAQIQAGDATVYVSAGGPPSPIAAVALIRHHVVFANRAEPLVEMATRAVAGDNTLSAVPAFASFQDSLGPRRSGGIYTDGSPAAEAARSALRAVLEELLP